MKTKNIIYIGAVAIFFGFVHHGMDKELAKVISTNNLKPIEETEFYDLDSKKVKLGQMLFFDKVLSGNKDISCATCHHPDLMTGDDLTLPIGVGGQGMGKLREMGVNRFRIPRNSPEIFNRGQSEWHTMFWDGRISKDSEGGFINPEDDDLPAGFDNILAVQAMFPVLSRDEMRGRIEDNTVLGEVNELALISNAAPQSVWEGIMDRVLQYENYRNLFSDVYPDVQPEDLGFRHAANAISAFEIKAFTLSNSPWDQYLAGDQNALSKSAKKGAYLFYNKANCNNCHSGKLMTDQKYYNLGVPQLGPGRGSGKPYDFGRFTETGQDKDLFAFRTPPLRNVAETGPWMHNGAFDNLEDVIIHHLEPEKSLKSYFPNHLDELLSNEVRSDEKTQEMLIASLNNFWSNSVSLTDEEITDLVCFLKSLTDPAIHSLGIWVPGKVPSGLPVDKENKKRKSYSQLSNH